MVGVEDYNQRLELEAIRFRVPASNELLSSDKEPD
jgi:hypothetical protein